MNRSTFSPALHLPVALVLCSSDPSEFASTRPKSRAVVHAIGSFMRAAATMLRYEPSSSERAISDTGVGELLRRR